MLSFWKREEGRKRKVTLKFGGIRGRGGGGVK